MFLKELSQEERPREKLIRLGSSSLSDSELLALILRIGSKEKNVIDLSREILQKYPYRQLARKSVQDFMKIPGIKKAKATQLVALFELSRRFQDKKRSSDSTLTNSEQVYDYVRYDFEDLPVEKVMFVAVNTKNKVLRKEFLFEGGLDYSIIDMRELLRRVFLYEASGFFLIHNHPSGDCTPSEDDITMTKQVQTLCDVLRIRFLDHLVVGDSYYSFRDHGLLE